MKYLIALPLLALAGCSSSNFAEEHELLNQAHKAEVRMKKADALQASGIAIHLKGKAEYQDAKKDRENALHELSERLK